MSLRCPYLCLTRPFAPQFVYHAWITDSKTAMKERSKERRRFWQRYTESSATKREQKEGTLHPFYLLIVVHNEDSS